VWRDKDNELPLDVVHIVYVKSSKLRAIIKKSVEDMADWEKWTAFFQYTSKPNHRETVNKVIDLKEALKTAGYRLMSVSQNE